MKLNIIGAGRAGLTLGRLFYDNKIFNIESVFNRSLSKAERSVEFIGSGTPINNLQNMACADVYMVTTSDNALNIICDSMLANHKFHKGSIVFHCSGVTPSTVLERLKEQGCYIASVHPIKSFADPKIAITNFHGTFCSAEGDPEAINILENAIQSIGGNLFRINTDKKEIYHCATVMACNNLVALMEASISMYMDAGLKREEAMLVIEPIVRGTIENIFKLGTTSALTGPVARGDTETIRKHLSSLENDNSGVSDVYVALGKWALKLSREQKNADTNDLDEIKRQFGLYRNSGGGQSAASD